jgi:hypothetical protein
MHLPLLELPCQLVRHQQLEQPRRFVRRLLLLVLQLNWHQMLQLLEHEVLELLAEPGR